MNRPTTLGLTFEPREDAYIASLSLRDLHSAPHDIDRRLNEAAYVYSDAIEKMRTILEENERLRKENRVVPAVLMWDLGNTIFELLDTVSSRGFEVEDLYTHLVRDLGVSKSTLKRVISARRHIPNRKMLAPDISWGSLKDAPKRYASEQIDE